MFNRRRIVCKTCVHPVELTRTSWVQTRAYVQPKFYEDTSLRISRVVIQTYTALVPVFIHTIFCFFTTVSRQFSTVSTGFTNTTTISLINNIGKDQYV